MRNLREYLWAETPDQALRLLHERPGRGAFLAGGTCLAVANDPALDFVIDLGRLGLDRLAVEGGGLRLGAALSIQCLAESPEVRRYAGGLLAEAASRTRSEPWRRQATLVGRLLEGDPADLLWPCLLVLEARARLLPAAGSTPQTLELDAALAPRPRPALVLDVHVPRPDLDGFALEALARSALDAPLAVVVAGAKLDGGRLSALRVAVSALGPEPHRAASVEAALAGRVPDAAAFAAALAALAHDIDPADDQRASAEYRAHLAGVLLGRALGRAVLAAGGSGGRAHAPAS